MSGISDEIGQVDEIRVETCEKHGEYESKGFKLFKTVMWSKCEKCAEEEQAQREADEERKKTEADLLRKRRALESLYEKSNIPRRYADSTLDHYAPKNDMAASALDACKSYAENFKAVYKGGRNLIMTGTPGTGKTHLSIAIMHRVIREYGVIARYTTAAGFIRGIRSTYNKDCEYTEHEYFDWYSTCALLVIDEIGVKFASDFERAALFEVIDNRYNERLPIILISNLTISEITESMGERMMDRLSEGGSVLAFNWKSHRRSA